MTVPTDLRQIEPMVTLESISDPTHPGYLNRVYAGVLGKLIGVYLGRPVENWSFERIRDEFGEIEYYIHEKRGRRLIVTDDDISGTFTFLRALEDYGYDPQIQPWQIGQTWLNYLIEKTTILWWGGMGNSTEHTAYLRLKSGIAAPRSGSSHLNSRVISEQIGGQIFIDGWGLICPGDTDSAAEYSKRAASVSHDGEGIYGAQIVATLVAGAFTEPNIEKLLDRSLSYIPQNSTISRLIDDLRKWHSVEQDWRENRLKLQSNYGYDRFPGNCHIVPNHGLIVLALLHGAGDFDESMKIVNTAGWDTDCNSGNLGTVLGVLNGLDGLRKQDWRGPVADRLYLPSADGGRSISDAVIETVKVVNSARAMKGAAPLIFKDGARFHFSLPGSLQGWMKTVDREGSVTNSIDEANGSGGSLRVSHLDGEPPVRVSTPTFIPPEFKDAVTGYVLIANPTLYPGHHVKFRVRAGSQECSGRLFLSRYGPSDESVLVTGPEWTLRANEESTFEWIIPDFGGYPIFEIGLELDSHECYIESVDWQGVPQTQWPRVDGTMWARAWAKALDRFEYPRDSYEYLTQNDGVGLLTHGARDWTDYRFEARLTPKMAVSAGIAVRVQGLRRYYAFVFGERGEIRIDKALDGTSTLAKAQYDWGEFRDYDVAVEVSDSTIRAFINGELVISATDTDRPLESGAAGFLVESGCLGAGTPGVRPI